MAAQFALKSKVAGAMGRRLPTCQDAQVEMNLQRACLGLSKVGHLLRANGSELLADENVLSHFDEQQLEGLRRLMPAITPLGVDQSFKALSFGGLGLSRAVDIAAAAHLASLSVARPKLVDLAEDCETVGLFWARDLVHDFDRQRQNALELYLQQVGEEHRDGVVEYLSFVDDLIAKQWHNTKTGCVNEEVTLPCLDTLDFDDDQGTHSLRARNMLESGHLRTDPDEMGQLVSTSSQVMSHIQRELSLLLEAKLTDRMLDKLEVEDLRGARRLAELLDKGTCHSWVWRTDRRGGSRLAEVDWLLAIQSRVGAHLVKAGAVKCAKCAEVLDGPCSHALCCAQAESTKGHYAVVAAVCDGVSLADPTTRTEARGLVQSAERPADILTSGPGFQVAMDITVAAQDAKQAGMDACASAYRRKMRNYAHLFPALRREGIVFRPMVWSAEGRPHARKLPDCST